MYCSCFCMDCIEGTHCGYVGEMEAFDGEARMVRCDYPVADDDEVRL